MTKYIRNIARTPQAQLDRLVLFCDTAQTRSTAQVLRASSADARILIV